MKGENSNEAFEKEIILPIFLDSHSIIELRIRLIYDKGLEIKYAKLSEGCFSINTGKRLLCMRGYMYS